MTISCAQVVVDGVRTVGWGKMKGVNKKHNGTRSSNSEQVVVDIITEQEEKVATEKTIEIEECTYEDRTISKNSTEACDIGHTYNTERLDLFVIEDQQRNNLKGNVESSADKPFRSEPILGGKHIKILKRVIPKRVYF